MWYFAGSGAEAACIVEVEEGSIELRFRWLIQSPSGTGLRTGLDVKWLMLLWPVDEVRGGIALGERRESDTIIDGPLWGFAAIDIGR